MLKDDIRKEYLEMPKKTSLETKNILSINIQSRKAKFLTNSTTGIFNFQKDNSKENFSNDSTSGKIIQVKWFNAG